jgi:hypothetical protein
MGQSLRAQKRGNFATMLGLCCDQEFSLGIVVSLEFGAAPVQDIVGEPLCMLRPDVFFKRYMKVHTQPFMFDVWSIASRTPYKNMSQGIIMHACGTAFLYFCGL